MSLAIPSRTQFEGMDAITLENDLLRAIVAPKVGGRVVSLVHKPTDYEFLWHNPSLSLTQLPPGSEYDPNFYGGIDELLPNDLPETVAGVDLPDHGELWALPLDCDIAAARLQLSGLLPRSELRYERRMGLAPDGPELISAYRITNESDRPQPVLWKLHAALNIEAGDRIICPAKSACVVDPEYTRWKTLTQFAWPQIDGERADIIPENDGTVDFLYLYDLSEGRIGWERPSSQIRFEYRFDTKIFPFAWYFGSYGGFLGHTTAILEPCTTMPISVNEAAKKDACLWLEPKEEVSTTITVYAGPTEL